MLDNIKYLELNISNAGLLMSDLSFVKITDENNPEKTITYYRGLGHNLNDPIPITTLINLLRKLANDIPIPMNKNRRNEIINEIINKIQNQGTDVYTRLAQKAYVNIIKHYNVKCYKEQIALGEHIYNKSKREPYQYGFNFIQSKSIKNNSNRQNLKDYVLFSKPNYQHKVSGLYTWQWFNKTFNYDKNNNIYIKLISLITDILNIKNLEEHYPTFDLLCSDLYDKIINDTQLQNKILSICQECEKLKKESKLVLSTRPLYYALFGLYFEKKEFYSSKLTTSNTQNSDTTWYNTCLLKNNGILYKTTIDATIIIEVNMNNNEEKKLVQKMANGCGFSTCLEGGSCYLKLRTNYDTLRGFSQIYSNQTPVYD